MKKSILFILIGVYCLNFPSKICCQQKNFDDFAKERLAIAAAMEKSLKTELLDPWYPRSVDSLYGGFLSSFTYDFKPTGSQEKMIVTQARHTWVNAKASERYPRIKYFKSAARHGFLFLKNVMWDKEYGGFYTLVDRKGNVIKSNFAEKEAYGNAFGIYALAAYYKSSRDSSALNLVKQAFLWLEKHSHDPVYKGYFQHMKRDGTPMKRTADIASTSQIGYKDQNSSIHLLEAFTELYAVWKDPLVRERLSEMLSLLQNKMINPKGDLILFLKSDWTPVSFSDSSRESIMKHHNLDHASFGHDVETAYLMLEATHALGNENDTKTLRLGKLMVDHALRNGWDSVVGGFYDEGYYFKGDNKITIIRDTKNWWAQAEGLNTLLMLSDYFPDDDLQYYEKFKLLWKYVQIYLIDHKYGDWYAGGLDKEPQRKTDLKGHIWKATYHQYRALENCINRLRK